MFGQSLLSAFGIACTTDTDQLFTTNQSVTSTATYQLNNATTSIPSNTYPGTASNITYAAGKFGNAAVFNGSSSYIDTNTAFTPDSMSFSVWVYPTDSSVFRTIFSNRGGDPTNYKGIDFGITDSGNIYSRFDNGGSRGSSNSNTVSLPLNTWTHLAFTVDMSNSIQKVYKNGTFVYQETTSGSIATGNDFYIGRYFNSSSSYWQGKIDQVRIFNTALPQAAITALYNETTTTATSASIDYVAANPNSIAYYKMSSATDQIGGNTLTNSNVNFNTEGKFGFAGAFNGSNSKLTISNSSFLPQGNNSRSISCWIKTTGGSNDGVIGYGNAVNSQAFFIYINNQNKLGIYCYYDNTDGTIAISNNTWNHVVATYDGTNCKLYVNGVLDFTTAKTLNTGNGEFRIGGVNWNNGGEFFPGDIDQIRIYDSAISAANVSTLYKEVECEPAAINALANFNTVLYTGDGSNGHSINTVGFKPDFTWIKTRTDIGGSNHFLFDSIRGATNRIFSNLTNGEAADLDSLVSFDSNGFTVDDDISCNGSGQSIVAWNWKGGGAYVTDTSGDLNADISANQEAGFSIIKPDVQTGVNQTIPHGLSQAPELIIQKTTLVSRNWAVYAPSIFAPSTRKLAYLNSDAAFTTGGASAGTGYAPSVNSTFIITPGVSGVSNYDYWFGQESIIYAFHSVDGYQKIGSYIGTAAAGNFQYTGFQPSWLMVKCSSASGRNWVIVDDKRGNSDYWLYPNTSDDEEGPYSDIVFNSTGFTLGTNASYVNGSGDTYIFLAIA